MLTSGIVDALTVVADATGPSTAARALVVRIQRGTGLVVVGDDSRLALPLHGGGAWLGDTLLGPEKSGAPGGYQVVCRFALWLFGCWIVDASIFVAVCSDRIHSSSR